MSEFGRNWKKVNMYVYVCLNRDQLIDSLIIDVGRGISLFNQKRDEKYIRINLEVISINKSISSITLYIYYLKKKKKWKEFGSDYKRVFFLKKKKFFFKQTKTHKQTNITYYKYNKSNNATQRKNLNNLFN